jgi:hypothetical protein
MLTETTGTSLLKFPTARLQVTERSLSFQQYHTAEVIIELIPQLCYLIAEFSDHSSGIYVRQISV